MRSTLRAFLFLTAFCTACEKPAAFEPHPLLTLAEEIRSPKDQGPLPPHLVQAEVPQDRERMARLRAARLAWARASTINAYLKVGNRDPKWDAAARDALEKVAVAKVHNDQLPDAVEAALDALRRAAELGCDDPCVRYFRVQYRNRLEGHLVRPGAYEKALSAVAPSLRDSRYPPIRRAHAAHNYLVCTTPAPTTDEDAEAFLASDDATAVRRFLSDALAADRERAAEDYLDLMRQTAVRCSGAPSGRRLAYEAYRDNVPAGRDYDFLRHWLTGMYHQEEAWKARGGAVAALVPEADMQAFHAGLEAAGDAYESAWELNPSHAEVAVGMMCVLGPVGDSEGLELWFRRAMTADPDCLPACRIKGNFLQPKWGGHSEAVRQFAARLTDTRNWDAGLPFASVELLAGGPLLPARFQTVAPENWALVARVYDEFLATHPDSRWGWTSYAVTALDSGQFEVALRAYDRIRDRPSAAAVGAGRRLDVEMELVRKSLATPKKQ